MRIQTDTDRCTGHGICESILPAVFEVGDDGLVHLSGAELTEDLRPLLESAVAECPSQALSLEG
ncbi:MAG TPA: ferredoxin [Mycobacteriales bacterium]|nr:ferredoxin [Mycobacteriales bacterium]